MKQGLVTLIPKPNKDTLIIDNWRGITLLNNDYKILAFLLAKRLKQGMNNIIHESQSGFMPGRHISNNIRLVLDLVNYRYLLSGDPIILFLDFPKAFDTISHEFIFDTLFFLNFGNFFIKGIKTLYKNNNSSIKLMYGTSQRFNVENGCAKVAQPHLTSSY